MISSSDSSYSNVQQNRGSKNFNKPKNLEKLNLQTHPSSRPTSLEKKDTLKSAGNVNVILHICSEYFTVF
jgi:hypothetical protein